jgi:hypothetical protein
MCLSSCQAEIRNTPRGQTDRGTTGTRRVDMLTLLVHSTMVAIVAGPSLRPLDESPTWSEDPPGSSITRCPPAGDEQRAEAREKGRGASDVD